MKIGVLTYYHDMNCGTSLQAYATLKAIKEVYPQADVSIIPIYALFLPYRPFIHNASLIKIFRDLRRVRFYKKFLKERLLVYNSKYIKEPQRGIKYIENLNLDKIYVGADTLLELGRTLPNGFDGLSYYWLSPKIRAKKYLIAASCGNLQYEQLSEVQKNEISVALGDFRKIGLRDANTIKLFDNFVDSTKYSLVPDPTYTLPVDYSYIDNYLLQRKVSISDNAILIHSSSQDVWVPEVANKLREKGYKVYSLSPAKWADEEIFNIDPLEQLGIYRYFRLVITNRFHDGIFCLKNKAPVLIYSEYGGNSETKFSSLIKGVGLYPYNIIEKKNITAEEVLNKVEDAIINFKEKQGQIKEFVENECKLYEDFLISTVND